MAKKNVEGDVNASETNKSNTESVRAKFYCGAASKNEDGSLAVSMYAVTSGSEENKAFSDATPAGNFYMHISAGKEAQGLFVVGKEYYLDITVSDTAEAEQSGNAEAAGSGQ